jgi:hypothetical protein
VFVYFAMPMTNHRTRSWPLAIALCAVLLATLGSGNAWACSGRPALECGEKADITADSRSSDGNMVVYTALVAANPRVRYVRDPALASFWAFEASAATVRNTLQYLLTQPGSDADFETAIGRLALPDPPLRRSHFVSGSLARAIRALERDEQAELTALESGVISLNRSHTAQDERARPDWGAFQAGAAARWLLHAAAAARRQVNELRAVSRALLRRHYLFGLGPRDFTLARKRIHAHGLPSAVVAGINRYQLGPDVLATARFQIEQQMVGGFSINLAQRLAAGSVLRTRKAFAAALEHFASRTPDAPIPAT